LHTKYVETRGKPYRGRGGSPGYTGIMAAVLDYAINHHDVLKKAL